MSEWKDIAIVDFDVEVTSGHLCYVRCALDRAPEGDWAKEFVSQYQKSGYGMNDRWKLADRQIVLQTLQVSVDSRLRRKIDAAVSNTNVAIREKLTRIAEEQERRDEEERDAAEARRRKEAELKRKLMGDDE